MAEFVNCFEFTRDQQMAVGLALVKWYDTHRVTGNGDIPGLLVVKGAREHASHFGKPLGAIFALLTLEVDQGVAVSPELVAF